MKTRFEIEIESNKQVSGGYIMTTEPMTVKQVEKVAEKMGREFMNNDKTIETLCYKCHEADNDDIKNAALAIVTLLRHGRKILVF